MSIDQRILGILSCCCTCIATLIFLLIYFIISKSRKELQDVSILLLLNTCSSSLLTGLTMSVMIISNLTNGFLIQNLHFCYIWGLFYDIFECSIYYSFCLQALFRLCRVIFYKKKWLNSYSLYSILTVVQWLLIVGLLIPSIPLQWYISLPSEKFCLVPYDDIFGQIYLIVVLYGIPLISISFIYGWIVFFIRYLSRSSTALSIASNQRQRNLRDLIIVRNIGIFIFILVALRFPTIIFLIYGRINGQLYHLTYSIVTFITSICLILIGCMTIFLIPPLRKNFFIIFICRNHQTFIQKTEEKVFQISFPVVDDVLTIDYRSN